MPSSTPAISSSSEPSPGSRLRFVMRTSGMRLQPSARIEPPAPLPLRAAVSRGVGKLRPQPAPRPAGLALRAHALVVVGEGAEPARRGRVGSDVHVLGAVAQRAEIVRLEEARARVGGLGAVDPVELRRVPHRLVNLELHLLGVDDDRRDPGRARIGAEESGGLFADARRFAFEGERLDVLPAGLCARAAVRTRVAADLRDALACGHRVDPGAALDDLLVDRGAVRGDEQLLLSLGAQEGGGHLDAVVLHALLGPQALLDLVGERDRERVLLDRRAVRAPDRLDGRERAVVPPRRRLRESRGPLGRRAGALGAQPVVAGEAPGAAHENADADPLALDVIEPVDALVPGRDRLAAPLVDARVGIGRAGGERRGHRLVAELPHPAKTNLAATTVAAGWSRNNVAKSARLRGHDDFVPDKDLRVAFPAEPSKPGSAASAVTGRRYNGPRALVAELVDAQG